MSASTADRMLQGPRFRSLCMAVVAELDPDLELLTMSVSGVVGVSVARLETFRAPQDLVMDFVDRVSAVEVSAVADWSDPLRLVSGLKAAVDSAMPWQPPWVEDAITGTPAIRDALRPTAEAILASPAAAWWGTDVQRDAQWVTRPVRKGRAGVVATPRPASETLRLWHQNQEKEEARSRDHVPINQAVSGSWWSTPHNFGEAADDWALLPSSTRRVGGLGALELELVEDSFGDQEALLQHLQPSPEVRVLEVHSSEDWATLVSQYPLSARWARRRVWWESTGREEHWLLPDFAAVAADYDAIHVSVHGYLSTAGRAIELERGATVLAGWSPDATYWLTDAFVLSSNIEKWIQHEPDEIHAWARSEHGKG